MPALPAIYHRSRLLKGRNFIRFSISLLLLSLIEINALGQHSVGASYASLRMNEVNIHAVRHFLENFPCVKGVFWTRDDDYYVASFHSGHSIDKAYYKFNGNFAFCEKYYLDDDMDVELKSTVLKLFPGSRIMLVTELSNFENKTYFVNIKTGPFIKTLRCNEDGIEITATIIDAG